MRPPDEDVRGVHTKPSLVIAADRTEEEASRHIQNHDHVRLLDDAGAAADLTPDQAALLVRLASLRQEHSDLDAAIRALAAAPHFDGLMAARLKKKKLRLKDMIEEIKDQLTPDIIA